ncbi:type IV pilus biogenesis/stability protein PilW [Pseudoalteromonas pernae]|uniref:type IV pilus biogenesis/stability protein PilW n=1 Tax=Pseudoalteromonas pernae TaxID=3118054 RepID=UPI0032427B47
MRKLLVTSISLLALGGCVTESTYVGSDKPVVEKKINNVDAARTRISLALNYLSQGNSTQAKYNLERAAKFAPELPEVHYSMAYYYQQVGESQRAKEAYERALAIEPNDPNTLNNYGVFLCDIGEYDAAVDKFMSAIDIPSYLRVAESYENLALCALEYDKFDAAESFLEDSLQHSSLRASSLINLAAVKYAKSDFHHAQQILNRYEKTGRVSSRSLLLSYLIEERMGHIEDAQNIAKTIEVTYPSSIEARIVREQKYSASEFEQLREQYRRHQINELQGSMDGQLIVSKPQIKIVKKKAPKNAEQQAVTPTTGEAAVESAALISVATPSPEPIVENVITQNSLVETGNNSQQSTEQTQNTVDEVSSEQQQQSTITDVAQAAVEQPESDTGNTVAQVDDKVDTTTETEQAETLVTQTNDEVAVQSSAQTSLADASAQTQDAVQSVEPIASVDVSEEVSVATENVAADERWIETSAPQPQKPAIAASESSANVEQQNVEQQKDTLQSELAREFAAQTDIPQSDIQELPNDLAAAEEELTQAPESTDEVVADAEDEAKPADGKVAMLSPDSGERPYHVMGEGETLFSVSARYNIRLSTLKAWNNLQSVDKVRSGQKIYIARPNNYHTVKDGETLSEISREYNILMQRLLEWNQLEEGAKLVPGDKIYLVEPKNLQL